ncbi:MAG: hypothetical protein JO039_16300 [Solirubrobacterales bacterium]|nr:hypothetical protein [Solirubrobacterales bacterium]
MPGRTFKVGRIAGIPVGISPWWLVIVALCTWSLGSGYFPAEVKGISSLASYGLGLASVLLLFASILAHEFGHALVARRRGVEVEEIDLWLLGGVSRMRGRPMTADDELPWTRGPRVKYSHRTQPPEERHAPSDKMKHQAEKATSEYDAHLTKAEDHREAAARKAQSSFNEHTAVPEAHLEKAEDHMEAAAHKLETQAADKDAEVRNRITSGARARVSKAPVVGLGARPADRPYDPPAPPPPPTGPERVIDGQGRGGSFHIRASPRRSELSPRLRPGPRQR